jgi:hypothetical protein
MNGVRHANEAKQSKVTSAPMVPSNPDDYSAPKYLAAHDDQQRTKATQK